MDTDKIKKLISFKDGIKGLHIECDRTHIKIGTSDFNSVIGTSDFNSVSIFADNNISAKALSTDLQELLKHIQEKYERYIDKEIKKEIKEDYKRYK